MDNLYIQKVLSGDRHAFRYFIRTYKDMAFSVALSLTKQTDQAEEVVQEAFIQAYLSLRSFKGDSKFSTWFYRIVVNCYYKSLRGRPPNSAVEFDAEVHDVYYNEDLLDQIIKIENKEAVNRALLLLPGNESLALRLFYLEEASIQEITQITGRTTSNVKVLLYRGRKRLREELTKLLK